MTHLMIGLILLLGIFGNVRAEVSEEDVTTALEIVRGECFICHGVNGESSSPIYPRLAGQHAEYIAKQLANFKSGARASDTMQPQTEELTPELMVAIGQYYEAKESPPADIADPNLAAMGRDLFHKGNALSGVPACTACHGEKGLGTSLMPRLAGQRANYVENQLKNFNKRVRSNDNEVMHSIASKLTPQEIHSLAEYISAMQ